MWIKAEDGRLYNLDHAHTIEMAPHLDNIQVDEGDAGTTEIDSEGGPFIIQIYIGDRVVHVTRPKATGEARYILDDIGQALESEHRDGFMDLTRMETTRRRSQ